MGTNAFSGRPSDLIGRQVAGYRVEREIGRGGMAVVFRARDLRLERTVALKLLAPELARNDTFRKRFTHESRVAAAIDHPHIVPVFEAGETDGVLYIAMRYVAGSDLRHLLDREGPLPPGTALPAPASFWLFPPHRICLGDLDLPAHVPIPRVRVRSPPRDDVLPPVSVRPPIPENELPAVSRSDRQSSGPTCWQIAQGGMWGRPTEDICGDIVSI